MPFEFSENIPPEFTHEPILISGTQSADLNGREFLIFRSDEEQMEVFEIRYKYHCSPFKEAALLHGMIAVGHETHFYLYNLKNKKNILTLKMNGYFGHLYFDDESIFVTDASGIYCLNKDGNLLWANGNLGIDGVIINNLESKKIFGSGELDPPGGWEDFIIDKDTGILTE